MIFASNLKRKRYLNLIEKDIEEDNILRQKLGNGYDIWKMTTLPNIVKKEKVKVENEQ